MVEKEEEEEAAAEEEEGTHIRQISELDEALTSPLKEEEAAW